MLGLAPLSNSIQHRQSKIQNALVDPGWHGAALALIGLITLGLAGLAGQVAGHETVAIGTIADRVYIVDGFFNPEHDPQLGVYRWSEPLGQLTLVDWGPGSLHLRVSGTAAGSAPNDITLKLDGQAIGHTLAPPGQSWTVEGTGTTAARNPALTLEGPRLDLPGDPRLLGRLVQTLEIESPDARNRAWENLALLGLAGLLLYAVLLYWSGAPGLALVAGAAVPAVFGLLAVYRDRWADAVAWAAPLALAGALVLDRFWILDFRFWNRSGDAADPKSKIQNPKSAMPLVALGAGLALVALGTMNAFDADRMYAMTAGLAEYGTPTKYPSVDSWSKYGFGQPLLAVPFYWLGKALLVFGGDREALTRFTVSLTNIGITTLLCGLLYRAARRFATAGVALAVVATFLLATPALNYARTFFSEPAGALLLLIALLLVVPAREGAAPGLRRLALAGACLGFMIWIKPAFAVYAPAPGLVALFLTRYAVADTKENTSNLKPQTSNLVPRTSYLRTAVAGLVFAAGPLIAEAGQLGYNYLRYGLWFHTGYEREPGFSTPLGEGLAGLLFSPGKSLFLYAPVLLLAPLGGWLLWRRGGMARVIALLIAAETVAGFAFNATWWAWTGNFAWGPRLIMPLLPLLCWLLMGVGGWGLGVSRVSGVGASANTNPQPPTPAPRSGSAACGSGWRRWGRW